MNQQHPISLYGVSRKHGNGHQITQIEETLFKISRSDEKPPSITSQNAIRFVSWMCGWNFIRIADYPVVSRSDVLGQIKDYVENNASSHVAGEEADTAMGTFVKGVLNTFAGTIDSLSNTLLKADEIPNIRLTLSMHMPPISVFDTIRKILESGIDGEGVEQMLLPRTSDNMLRQELEYYVNNNHTFQPYKQHLTASYLMMHKLLKDNPNADIQHVFDECMKRSHERTFQPHTHHRGVSILKAEIADYINALEIAVQIPPGNERDHHLEVIRVQLLRNMYDTYQMFLLFKHYDDIKKIDNIQSLHMAIEHIFTKIGTLLLNILQRPATADSEYNKYVTKPMNELITNLDAIHLELCHYVQFKETKFGYAYGMVDIISAQLFQIILLMMSGVDNNTTTKLCIHTFSAVIVDMFFQRLMTHVWDKQPTPIASPYTNYVLSRYRPIQSRFNKINRLAELNTNPDANLYQEAIKNLIEQEKWDNSFFDFLVAFNFSFADRHTYNLQSFARKIKSENNTDILPHNFGWDLLDRLTSAITESQSIMNKMIEQRGGSQQMPKPIYLYDRSIISAVIFACGVEEFVKRFDHGTLYKSALSALLSDNKPDGK